MYNTEQKLHISVSLRVALSMSYRCKIAKALSFVLYNFWSSLKTLNGHQKPVT